MPKKSKTDGLQLAIVIVNILTVAVIVALCALIYLYMTGCSVNGRNTLLIANFTISLYVLFVPVPNNLSVP